MAFERSQLYETIPRRVENIYWKLFYPLLTGLTRNTSLTFLNYGYADLDHESSRPTLKADDEANRAGIQLYDRVTRGLDLSGKRVLEVSCGHGGGASYIARYRGAAVHGIDRNPRAVAFCRRKHKADGLRFTLGDALALPFPEAAFDAVLNVEASHCYPDFGRFLREVLRVLKPGGHFLYADFRDSDGNLKQVRESLAGSGLEMVSESDISRNVLRGMQLNTPRYLALTRELAPRCLQEWLKDFTGVTGSHIYRKLESGRSTYFAFVLRRPLAA